MSLQKKKCVFSILHKHSNPLKKMHPGHTKWERQIGGGGEGWKPRSAEAEETGKPHGALRHRSPSAVQKTVQTQHWQCSTDHSHCSHSFAYFQGSAFLAAVVLGCRSRSGTCATNNLVWLWTKTLQVYIRQSSSSTIFVLARAESNKKSRLHSLRQQRYKWFYMILFPKLEFLDSKGF